MECGECSVECGASSVNCELLSVESRAYSVKCKLESAVCGASCELYRKEGGVQTAARKVLSVECRGWRADSEDSLDIAIRQNHGTQLV